MSLSSISAIIADTLLSSICVELIDNVVAAGPATSNGFFQAYYLSLLQDMFFVLTDTDHKSGQSLSSSAHRTEFDNGSLAGFKNQSTVLAKLFRLIEGGDIQAPLYDPATVDPSMTNGKYVAEYCANLLKTAFPHLQTSVLRLRMR